MTLLATGVIHAAQITSHLDDSLVTGLFFVAVAGLQATFAAVLLMRRMRWIEIAALALTVGTIAVWAATRTIGIPIGSHPGTSEAIGVADAVATGFELMTGALLTALLMTSPRLAVTVSPGRRRNRAWKVATALAIILGSAGITAVALRAAPVHVHEHDEGQTPTTSGNQELLELLEHHGSHKAVHGSK